MDRIVTWPNAITIARMIIGIVGICVAMLPEYFLWGILVFFVFGLTPDFLDGWLARVLNQRTRIGEFIDPLADKILFYFAAIVLFSQHVWWLVLVALCACDVISTVVHFYKKGGAVKTGKWKFGLQCIALVIFTIGVLWWQDIVVLANVAMLLALFCAIHSLYHRING